MIKINSSFKLITIATFAILLSGCINSKPSSYSVTNDSLEDKNAEFTLSGRITNAGGTFFITDGLGKSYDIESYSYELDNYVGKTVSVTGQYSGDTLFVSSIE